MISYTCLVRQIIADIAEKVSEFAHLEPEKIAVATASRFAGTTCGNLAMCVGLRETSDPTFNVMVNRRTKQIVQVTPWYLHQPVKIYQEGIRAQYMVLLKLPRLLMHDPLETIVHELFHIGENFDGKLRPMRHGKTFDRNVAFLMQRWLDGGADPELARMSQMTLEEMRKEHGTLVGRSLPGNYRHSAKELIDAPMSYKEGVRLHYPKYKLARKHTMKPMRPRSAPQEIDIDACRWRAYHDDGAEYLPKEFSPYLGVASRTVRPDPTAETKKTEEPENWQLDMFDS